MIGTKAVAKSNLSYPFLSKSPTYILYDLEAIGSQASDDFMEIVEIGAYKVKFKEGKPMIIDRFHSYITPIFHSHIPKKLTPYIHVDENELKNAGRYYEVYPKFMKWAGKGAVLTSWGYDEDMFYSNNKVHYLFDDTRYSVLNLQNVHDVTMNKKRRTGLETALSEIDSQFVGTHHTACDDAYNLLPFLSKYKDKLARFTC